MTQTERLELLKLTVDSLAAVYGNDTEIALHDLTTQKLVHIVNGNITGRAIGYNVSTTVYRTIISMIGSDNVLVGYSTHSPKGKKLRASHILYRDEKKIPVALICINQDVSKLEELRDYLDSQVRSTQVSEQKDVETDTIDENYIQKITQKIIMETIEKSKPSSLEEKETKLDILRELEAKGVFAVKDAVPAICKTLSISQATLYNYLREIRSQSQYSASSPFGIV